MQRTRLLLAGLLLLAAVPAFAAERDALASFYAAVEDLRADFDQVQVDESGEVLQRASGIFLLERPDKFRWEYREPYRQVIVSDGREFRFYDVDLAQVTVRDVDASLSTTPAQLLAGGTGLTEAFAIEPMARDSEGLDWVRLTPRSDDSDFREIRLGLQDDRPVRLDLDDQLGQTTRIRFSDIRINGGIDDERFRLDVPDDVDIVDDRGGVQP